MKSWTWSWSSCMCCAPGYIRDVVSPLWTPWHVLPICSLVAIVFGSLILAFGLITVNLLPHLYDGNHRDGNQGDPPSAPCLCLSCTWLVCMGVCVPRFGSSLDNNHVKILIEPRPGTMSASSPRFWSTQASWNSFTTPVRRRRAWLQPSTTWGHGSATSSFPIRRVTVLGVDMLPWWVLL